MRNERQLVQPHCTRNINGRLVCATTLRADVCSDPVHRSSLPKFARDHGIWRLARHGRGADGAPVRAERSAAALGVALHHGAARVVIGARVERLEELVQRCVAYIRSAELERVQA